MVRMNFRLRFLGRRQGTGSPLRQTAEVLFTTWTDCIIAGRVGVGHRGS